MISDLNFADALYQGVFIIFIIAFWLLIIPMLKHAKWENDKYKEMASLYNKKGE